MSRLRLEHTSRTGASGRQAGAASLIVVMVLFFVLSMVAAYTNRNLIFEQKTAANQQRSTRALEAADAGVEWALTMLNTGRITATCATSALNTDTDFRQRYLIIDPATGNITPRKQADGSDLHPTCVYDGANWACDCPSNAAPAVATPAGTGIFPAFRVRFRRHCGPALANAPDNACVVPFQPGVVHVDVNACTTLNEDCLKFPTPEPLAGEGRATVHVVAALRSALPVSPGAALTVLRGINVSASPLTDRLQATNSYIDVEGKGRDLGIAVHTSTPVVGPTDFQGKAGTPTASAVIDNDAILGALTGDRLFANTFGLQRTTFRDQPAALQINCATSCSAATLRARIALNPGRPIWVIGNLDFDSAGDIGSALEPVLLNVTGSVTFSSPVTVFGMIYSQAGGAGPGNGTWTISGGGSVIGAAVAEGNLVASGSTTTHFQFDQSTLTPLKTITGSFVRVPGTWRDFE